MDTAPAKKIDLLNPSHSRRETSPLWSKGFRPFFILAALQALVFMPIWLAAFVGRIDVGAYWSGPVWHGHEMIFGFTIAVIAGFLLTAVGNWTRRETAIGGALALLAGLWVAGRVVVALSAYLPGLAVMLVDLAFIPALAVAIGRPIVETQNKRNYGFLVILAAFFVANLGMHMSATGLLDTWTPGADLSRYALMASVDLTLLITLIVTGRIVPLFTRNATGNASIEHDKVADRLALVGMVALALLTALNVESNVVGIVAILTGAMVLWRMRKWGTLGTLKVPILWVLHLGHAWIGVGLLLRGVAEFTPAIAATFATHVLTIGGIGTLIIGMMTRVARGHTGRSLEVSRAIVFAYVLITLAVLARGLLPVFLPAHAWTAYLVSGIAWCLTFGIYLWKYVPILVAPRADAV